MEPKTPWMGEYVWEENKCDGSAPQSVPLPDEVVAMFRPTKCLLCGIITNNQQSAFAHYESKGHFKKVAQYMREKFNVLGTLKSKEKFRLVRCEICQIDLTSRIVLMQHYEGKQHLKNLKKKTSSDGTSAATENKDSTDVPTSTVGDGDFENPLDFLKDLPPPPPLPKLGIYFCSLCQVKTKSKPQMEIHNNGSRHIKNLSKLADGELKEFFLRNGNCEPVESEAQDPTPPSTPVRDNQIVNPFPQATANASVGGFPFPPVTSMPPPYSQMPYGPYPQFPMGYDYNAWNQGQQGYNAGQQGYNAGQQGNNSGQQSYNAVQQGYNAGQPPYVHPTYNAGTYPFSNNPSQYSQPLPFLSVPPPFTSAPQNSSDACPAAPGTTDLPITTVNTTTTASTSSTHPQTTISPLNTTSSTLNTPQAVPDPYRKLKQDGSFPKDQGVHESPGSKNDGIAPLKVPDFMKIMAQDMEKVKLEEAKSKEVKLENTKLGKVKLEDTNSGDALLGKTKLEDVKVGEIKLEETKFEKESKSLLDNSHSGTEKTDCGKSGKTGKGDSEIPTLCVDDSAERYSPSSTVRMDDSGEFNVGGTEASDSASEKPENGRSDSVTSSAAVNSPTASEAIDDSKTCGAKTDGGGDRENDGSSNHESSEIPTSQKYKQKRDKVKKNSKAVGLADEKVDVPELDDSLITNTSKISTDTFKFKICGKPLLVNTLFRRSTERVFKETKEKKTLGELKELKESAPNSKAEGNDGKAPNEGNDGKAPTEGNDGKAPTEGNDGKAPTVGNDSNASTERNDGKAPSEGNDGKALTVGNDGKSPTVGNDGKSPTEGNDGKAPTEGNDGKAPTVGNDSNAPTEGSGGNAPTEGSDGKAPSEGVGVVPNAFGEKTSDVITIQSRKDVENTKKPSGLKISKGLEKGKLNKSDGEISDDHGDTAVVLSDTNDSSKGDKSQRSPNSSTSDGEDIVHKDRDELEKKNSSDEQSRNDPPNKPSPSPDKEKSSAKKNFASDKKKVSRTRHSSSDSSRKSRSRSRSHRKRSSRRHSSSWSPSSSEDDREHDYHGRKDNYGREKNDNYGHGKQDNYSHGKNDNYGQDNFQNYYGYNNRNRNWRNNRGYYNNRGFRQRNYWDQQRYNSGWDNQDDYYERQYYDETDEFGREKRRREDKKKEKRESRKRKERESPVLSLSSRSSSESRLKCKKKRTKGDKKCRSSRKRRLPSPDVKTDNTVKPPEAPKEQAVPDKSQVDAKQTPLTLAQKLRLEKSNVSSDTVPMEKKEKTQVEVDLPVVERPVQRLRKQTPPEVIAETVVTPVVPQKVSLQKPSLPAKLLEVLEKEREKREILKKMALIKMQLQLKEKDKSAKKKKKKGKSKKHKKKRSLSTSSSSSSSSSSSDSSSSSSSSASSTTESLAERLLAKMKKDAKGPGPSSVLPDLAKVLPFIKKSELQLESKKKKKKKAKKVKSKKNKKKSRKDESVQSSLASYITPSGTYYCKYCNLSLASGNTFIEHFLTEKHKLMYKLVKEKGAS